MNSPKRGEVWWCEHPDFGRRPVVVLSRDVAIPRLQRTLIAPCTTTVRNLRSEVELDESDPVPVPCVINLDSVTSAPLTSLTSRLGRLSDFRIRQICSAMATALDC